MNRTLWRVFLLLESGLWLTFMTADLLNVFDTTWLKYSAILLLMIAGLLCADLWKGRTVASALVFTAAADLFLLVLDKSYAVGIALFCVVQLLYAVRLGGLRSFCFGIPVVLIPFCLLSVHGIVDSLAAGYIALFAVNLIHAGILFNRFRDPPHKRFFTGLVLFFACDLCVGLFQAASGPIWEFARIGMWAFYLPGQMLILASAVRVVQNK